MGTTVFFCDLHKIVSSLFKQIIYLKSEKLFVYYCIIMNKILVLHVECNSKRTIVSMCM